MPQTATQDRLAPLLVLLHGSGRDGRTLMDPWAPFAKQHGIILAAPDAVTREGWDMREDGPDFLYALIEMLRVQHPVDPRRIYLFGHSAGAVHGLAMAVLESEYFAATAVHAGKLTRNLVPFIDRAPRKIPIAIWVGTNDHFFPVAAVRATRDALNGQGFAAELTEISDPPIRTAGRTWLAGRSFLQENRRSGDREEGICLGGRSRQGAHRHAEMGPTAWARRHDDTRARRENRVASRPSDGRCRSRPAAGWERENRRNHTRRSAVLRRV